MITEKMKDAGELAIKEYMEIAGVGGNWKFKALAVNVHRVMDKADDRVLVSRKDLSDFLDGASCGRPFRQYDWLEIYNRWWKLIDEDSGNAKISQG